MPDIFMVVCMCAYRELFMNANKNKKRKKNEEDGRCLAFHSRLQRHVLSEEDCLLANFVV